MGYKPIKKLYNLQFEDFPGLEVAATGTSLGKLMHLSSLRVNMNEEDEEKRMEVFKFFAGQLVKWNIDHPEIENLDELKEVPTAGGSMMVCAQCAVQPGAPMPCTVESLMCLELSFIMKIIFGWMGAIARVSVPKELSLSDGGKNIEEAMMRLVQHQNLSTLPTPNLS